MQSFERINIAFNIFRKILKEVGIANYLTCLLRTLYAGQETTKRHGTTDWFKIGKGVSQVYIWSPAYLTSVQVTSCEILGWMNQKMKSRLPGETSVTLDMQMIPL